MTTKQAREGLTARLTDTLKKYGFKFVKSRERFEGPEKNGFFPTFTYHVVDRGASAELLPQVTLRSGQIEDLVNQGTGESPQATRHRATMGEYLGAFTGDLDRWRAEVKTDQDLESAGALIAEGFAERALRFYETYGSLAAIDELINAHPEQPARMFGADRRRAEVGVAVARLLGRQDLPRLIEEYRRQLPLYYKREVPEFDRFLGRLNATAVK